MESLVIGVGNTTRQILDISKQHGYMNIYYCNINDWREFNVDISEYSIIYLIVDYSNQYDVLLAAKLLNEIDDKDIEVFTIIMCFNCENTKNIFKDNTCAIAYFKELNKETINQITGVIKTIEEVVNKPSLINIDFSDLQFIAKGKHNLVVATGSSSGKERAKLATTNALGNIDLSKVESIIICMTSDNS